jgi:hypothetical protein
MSQRQNQILSQSLSGLRTEQVEATLPGLYEWYRKTFEKAGWIILAIHKSSSKPDYATKVAAYVSGTNRLISELKTRLSDPKNNQTITRDFPNMVKDLEELKGFMSTMGNSLKQAALSAENIAVQDKSLYGLYKWFKHVFEKFGWMVLILNKLKYGAYVNQPTLETFMRNKLIMYSQSLEILYKSLEARRNSSNDLDIDNVKIDIESMLRNLTILRNCVETNMIETPSTGMVVRPIASSQIVAPFQGPVPVTAASGRSGTLALDSPTSTVGSATAAVLPANLSATSAAPIGTLRPSSFRVQPSLKAASFRAADSVTSPAGSTTAAIATDDLSATSAAPVGSLRVVDSATSPAGSATAAAAAAANLSATSAAPVGSFRASTLRPSTLRPSSLRVPSLRASTIQPSTRASSLKASSIQPQNDQLPIDQSPLSQSSIGLLEAAAQAQVLSPNSQTLIPMSDTPVSPPMGSRVSGMVAPVSLRAPPVVTPASLRVQVPDVVTPGSLRVPVPAGITPASLRSSVIPPGSLRASSVADIPMPLPVAPASLSGLSGMEAPAASMKVPSYIAPVVSGMGNVAQTLSRAVNMAVPSSLRAVDSPQIPNITVTSASNAGLDTQSVKSAEAEAISRLLQAQSASQSPQTVTQSARQTPQTLSATSPLTVTSSSSTLF